MGKVLMTGGGGGGVGSDELTATLGDVLKGKTVVASDTGDEIGTGTLELTGNAKASDVLPGKTFYNTNAKSIQEGAMPTKAAATYYATTSDQTISAGQYLGGAQTIKALSQSNLVAGNILKGKTITISNGSTNVWSVAGALAVTSAINFSATALSASSIRISWTNPSKGPWSGVFIQMSTSGYPGASGGTRIYTGAGVNTTPSGSNYADITGLEVGTTYYFTCTSYCDPLAWGASYNVSATTKGFLLFSPGVNPAGLAPDTGAESYYIVYDNYIHVPKTSMVATKYNMKSTKAISVNLSQFSTLNWTVMCTGFGGSQPIYYNPQFAAKTSSGAELILHHISWDLQLVNNTRVTFSKILSSTDKTHTITSITNFAMEAYCEAEDENGTQPWAGYIYKVWFE